jgi:CheY-like chemotaxis protein
MVKGSQTFAFKFSCRRYNKVANNGKEALELFQKEAMNDNPFDLVLMDLQMPVMDGLSSTRAMFRFCEQHANVMPPRIVALTADVAQGVIDECRSVRMHGRAVQAAPG